MANVLGIIPARGGSTRVKNKNIRDLNGYPLIAWTIYDLLNAELVDDIVVSTDDKRIKEIALEYGATVLDRPKEISGEYDQLESAITHVYDYTNEDYDYILTCQCTTPFRAPSIIDKGIQMIEEKNSDSLVYVCESDRFLWDRKHIPINYDYKNRVRSQDKEWELVEYGDYLCTPELLLSTGNRIGGKIELCVGNKLSYFDIDTELDLKIANGIAKELGLNAKD